MTSPSGTAITVMDHRLNRLNRLGVRHLFGMAVDYNLAVLDRVLAHPGVDWIGTSSELGAGTDAPEASAPFSPPSGWVN